MTVAAYLVGGLRTPVARHGGALSYVRPDDLASLVLQGVVEQVGIDPERVDEVILGNTNQAGEDSRNVARMATLLAGFPVDIPGITVNRLCASGMSAVTMAAQMVQSGAADVVLAGGVESMTRAPWVMGKSEKAFARVAQLFDTSIGTRFPNSRFATDWTLSMPHTAERVAERFSVSREEADRFAFASHEKALRAIDEGRFRKEILPVTTDKSIFDTDESPRRGTSLDKLSNLNPVTYPGGVVTAGNASPLNDGASAVVVASEKAVSRMGLIPRARFVTGASAGVSPEVMGIGPVPATKKALDRAGWTVDDLQTIELNEAFATQAIACIRELKLDPDTVNADGGAIALGHALGSSGSRIILTLMGRMEREGTTRGLATMCVGMGQGTAVVLERV